MQFAQDAPKGKRLTARQKKKLQKVVEKKQKNAARAQLIADLQVCGHFQDIVGDCVVGSAEYGIMLCVLCLRWLELLFRPHFAHSHADSMPSTSVLR